MRVLIFGANSFTAKHFKRLFSKKYELILSTIDITNEELVKEELAKKPDFIINFAAISFAMHSHKEDFFKVNLIGAENILKNIDYPVKKVILPSSAAVYGYQQKEILSEDLCPNPNSYYALSKLNLEQISKNYSLPIILTRPFNYTGVCHSKNFVIPKIISHYKEKKREIKLGNIDTIREYNDVEFVCKCYDKLLNSSFEGLVNIASQRGFSLREIINLMNEIAGYKIKVIKDKKLIRKEPLKLIGDKSKLTSIIDNIEPKSIKELLEEMYRIDCNAWDI